MTYSFNLLYSDKANITVFWIKVFEKENLINQSLPLDGIKLASDNNFRNKVFFVKGLII